MCLTNSQDSNSLNLKKPENTASATNWAQSHQLRFSRSTGSSLTLAWKTRASEDSFMCKHSPLSLQNHQALTRKVVLKAGLCRNHPFSPGLAENSNGALWLQSQCSESTAEVIHSAVHFEIVQPFIIPKN